MTQQDMIPFRRIVEMVREFCSQRRTGTVFIVSDDNRMAQVHLESGNIVALLCRGRHGQEAVAGMRTMQAGRLRFDDNYLTASDAERFDTHALLELLGAGTAASPRAAERPAPAPAASGAVTLAQAAALEQCLVQFIGPMAEILCADHVAQAANLPALIAVLADEIPDKTQAARFTREAGRLLGLH
ncbi:MAG TPA: hypothetical protein VFT05_01520 [Burkholderiaceae bacterium]|nr:hypothetical protein [Burkholderiaceae bacterium]